MTTEDCDIALSDWEELCREFGVERFTDALREAKGVCKFFPGVADIKEIMVRDQQTTKYPEFKHAQKVDCLRCDDTGWEPVEGVKNPTRRRCICRSKRA